MMPSTARSFDLVFDRASANHVRAVWANRLSSRRLGDDAQSLDSALRSRRGEKLGDQGANGGAVAHGRGDALDGPRSDVPSCKHSGQAGLERQATPTPILRLDPSRIEVAAGDDEAVVVAGKIVGQPIGVWLG